MQQESYQFVPQPRPEEPGGVPVVAQWKIPAFDPWLFIATAVLAVGGIPMLFSASFPIAIEQFHSETFFVLRQAAWVAAGFTALYLVSCVNLRWLRRWSPLFYLLILILLAAVLYSPFGYAIGGARRWLKFPHCPPFQPSEFAKVVFIIILARFLAVRSLRDSRYAGTPMTWKGWLGVAALTLPVVALIFPEPHLSTALLVLVAMFAMVFIAGAPPRHIAGVMVVGAVLSLFMFGTLRPYQRERVIQFITGKGDKENERYQVHQSQMAFAGGGLLGQGFGNGKRKLLYLPAAHTDFIFSVVGEEFGLVGTLCTLMLYLFIVYKCYLIGHRAHDQFASLMCAGIATLIALQTVVNIGVATAMLPTTGVPLPFLSCGGSGLMALLTGVGLVLNVSRDVTLMTGGDHDAPSPRGRWNGRAHLPRAGAR